ncbi:MAG: methyltransferase [Sediminibacterium sp.]|nr:methyltransferase [Sediminibacterium sp.]
MQKEIGNRLLERLDYMRIVPNSIADLGCGTGYCTQLLAKRYPNADIIAVEGNPQQDVSSMGRVQFVMKGGKVFKQ